LIPKIIDLKLKYWHIKQCVGKHAAERYMEVRPKERKIFESSNLRGLHFFLCKEVIEKSRRRLFSTLL